jgi:conjugal transfer/entry exclusion protein
MEGIKLNKQILVESPTMRTEVVNKDKSYEVFNKVKYLAFFGKMTKAATIHQVADYYEIDIGPINNKLSRKEDEFRKNAVFTLKGQDLKQFKETLKQKKGSNHYDGNLIQSILNQIKYAPKINMFKKSAVLRIGMLLEESPVAEEVRNYLINLEANATPTQKMEALQENPQQLTINQLMNVVDAMKGTLYKVQQNQEKLNRVENEVVSIKSNVKKISEGSVPDTYSNSASIAQTLGVTSAKNKLHAGLIGGIARELGLNTHINKPYEDEYLKIVHGKGNIGLQIYFSPKAVELIEDWWEDYSKKRRKEVHYRRNSKYGQKGDLRKVIYRINGTEYKTIDAVESAKQKKTA